MRIGALLMPTDDWPTTVATVTRLERLGFDHLWVYDHFGWQRYHERPWHGTYTWLAGVAAATTRIRIGTMVANPNIRHPLALAKDVMTIDHISDGRLTLGIGAGGTGFDATVFGDDPLPPADRLDRLREFTYVVDRLLKGELHDHEGRWYTIVNARVLPGAVQQPRLPFALAGAGRRSLEYVASHADAWITHGVTGAGQSADETWAKVEDQVAALAARCAQIERPWDDLDRILLTGLLPESPLADLAEFERFVERATTLGFTDVVFHHPRADDPVWNQDPLIVDQISEAFGLADTPAR